MRRPHHTGAAFSSSTSSALITPVPLLVVLVVLVLVVLVVLVVVLLAACCPADDASASVPMVIYDARPGRQNPKSGPEVTRSTQLIDIFPTILDLAKVREGVGRGEEGGK